MCSKLSIQFMLRVLLAANTRINISVFAAIINHSPVCLKLIMGVSS